MYSLIKSFHIYSSSIKSVTYLYSKLIKWNGFKYFTRSLLEIGSIYSRYSVRLWMIQIYLILDWSLRQKQQRDLIVGTDPSYATEAVDSQTALTYCSSIHLFIDSALGEAKQLRGSLPLLCCDPLHVGWLFLSLFEAILCWGTFAEGCFWSVTAGQLQLLYHNSTDFASDQMKLHFKAESEMRFWRRSTSNSGHLPERILLKSPPIILPSHVNKATKLKSSMTK